MSNAQFDLVVIGSGPAGEKAAAQAAYFGHSVAIVEEADRLGGAPVRTGGIRARTLRETALYLTSFRRREIYGLGLDLSVEAVLERLRSRETSVSDSFEEAVRRNLDRHGITVLHGRGAINGQHNVTVTDSTGGEEVVTGNAILVATGSSPFHPPDVPFDDPDVHDSDTILELDRIPGSIVVIGSGPVGSEFASIFTALGVEVTLVDSADHLMPFLDRDLSAALLDEFIAMGMSVLVDSPPVAVERRDGQLRVLLGERGVLTPDKVLFAAGRRGNTAGLGLEDAGVELDARGRVVVDERYETTVPRIFAAGDVIGPPALAAVSAEQGRVAACHAFGIPFKETIDNLPPYGIYSVPEIGMVGMTEEAAVAAGIPCAVGRHLFADNSRSRIAGTTAGLIKLVFDRNDRRLLGVHILGEEAAELVHIGQAAIHAREQIDVFIHSTFNVPSRTEAYKYAAYDGLQAIQGRRVGE